MSTSALTGRGSGVAAECVHELFSSAKNAADKGQSSWETPVEFAKLAAIPLPKDRRTLVDLCAGHGQMLVGASNGSTQNLLALDIENCKTISHKGISSTIRIAGDVGPVYSLAKEIDAKFDLFVLNPFWDVHYYRKSITKLAESDLETVRRAFEVTEPRCGADVLDSTVAVMMMSLDLMSRRGEGVLLANNSSMERLIFGLDAPYRLLENHCWARIILKGNPMTARKEKTHEPDDDFELAVIYYAASHDTGLGRDSTIHCEDIAAFAKAVETLALGRYRLRTGPWVNNEYHYEESSEENWKGIRAEWEIRSGKRNAEHNLWLTPSGTIGTYLSLFDAKDVKIPKEEAKTLFTLSGKKPMSLVTARDTRQLLLHHANGGIWRVSPELKAAVEAALAEYYRVRAPLSPLNEIQSLGFVEEEDMLECKMDLEYAEPSNSNELSKLIEEAYEAGYVPKLQHNRHLKDIGDTVILDPRPGVRGRPTKDFPQRWTKANKELVAHVKGEEFKPESRVMFHAGKSYPIRTQTVKVSRTVEKPGMDGENHQHYLAGQELAIFLKDDTGVERCFMDRRLTEIGATIEGEKEVDHGYGKVKTEAEIVPDFDLQTLVRNFKIPVAPDVASCRPEQYRKNLSFLDEVEVMVNSAN